MSLNSGLRLYFPKISTITIQAVYQRGEFFSKFGGQMRPNGGVVGVGPYFATERDLRDDGEEIGSEQQVELAYDPQHRYASLRAQILYS
jgi:hypothetical protein